MKYQAAVLQVALLSASLLMEISAPSLADTVNTVRFDLPSQSLATALEAFSTTTGMFGAYDANLVDGQVSSAVKGVLTPEVALGLLVTGTGLIVEYTGDNAFVIRRQHEGRQLRRDPGQIGQAGLSLLGGSERRYSALLQQSVEDALCSDSRTRQGNYRAAIAFGVDADGRLQAVRLLGPTGDSERDAAIVAVTRRISVGEPPPANMHQPFAMVVLPPSPISGFGCAGLGGG